MSTRSIIGTANDAGFSGRYCHWDGYPTARGPQLLATYAELGSLEAVIVYAVRPGVAGYWSSYAPPERAGREHIKPDKVPCPGCGATGIRPSDASWDAGSRWAKECGGCNYCAGSGMYRNPDKSTGWQAENGDSWADQDNDWGSEWAYLLSEEGVTILENDWRAESGNKWVRAAFVAWDATETDWGAIERRETVSS